ncbi:MAG: glycosyltransferase [Verrucomicrobiota bacterium]|nr:glycosyltransferase [Verrucomicrobiota bacterium]
MTPPLLSICVMTYNRRRTLEETLDSIFPQVAAREEVEVVICDNASTDDTEAFVASRLTSAGRLRYHRNSENLGVDGNIVTCFEQAHGNYVALFSDDDLAPPNHFDFILREIEQTGPTIWYCNHAPFFHGDSRHLAPPRSPLFDRIFRDGQEFILQAGLGFLSSLMIARAPALTHLKDVIHGTGAAHLDIAYRIALTTAGPFVYRGSQSVYARSEQTNPPALIGGCVNLARLFRALVDEGLVGPAIMKRWLSGQVRYVLPRQVFTARGRNIGVYPLRGMVELYGSIPAFYWWVLPLYLLPKFLVRALFLSGRWLLHCVRRARYAGAAGSA